MNCINGLRPLAMAVVLGMLSVACSDDAGVTEPTSAAGEGHSDDHDHDHDYQEVNNLEPADCLSNWLSLATFVVPADSTLTVEGAATGQEEPFVTAEGGANQNAIALHRSLTPERLGRVEFLDSGVAEELGRLIEAPPAAGKLYVVGRSNPDRVFATVLLQLEENAASGFDPCTLQWRDVTDELGSATLALGAAEALDALSMVVAETDEAGGRFARAWDEASSVELTWLEREPSERHFTDPDLPPDIAATLVPLRIQLAWDSAQEIDETNPFALCPHQSTAASGYCVPLYQLSLVDGIVLEVAVDPSQPVEIWLHDERHDPLGSAGPILTVSDLEVPTALTVTGEWPAELQSLTAEDAANLLSISGKMTSRDVLDSPSDSGLPLVGGVGVVETGYPLAGR